jgi:hypothetical protein
MGSGIQLSDVVNNLHQRFPISKLLLVPSDERPMRELSETDAEGHRVLDTLQGILKKTRCRHVEGVPDQCVADRIALPWDPTTWSEYSKETSRPKGLLHFRCRLGSPTARMALYSMVSIPTIRSWTCFPPRMTNCCW